MLRKTPERIRQEMTEFCDREMVNASKPMDAYIAALSSAAHLCDQVARESTRSAERLAATKCGDFIMDVHKAMQERRAEINEAEAVALAHLAAEKT